MRFNEKLQYLRREKKLSQEQLADMLDVTRQSVSKWESGTTYPEMDKLIMLCKIFKCSLDDLTNDEVTDINVEKKVSNTFSLNNILDNILGLIKKTVKMFQTMSIKQRFGCLITMFWLGVLLSLLYLPIEAIGDSINGLLGEFVTHSVVMLVGGLFRIILLIIFISIYVLVYVYIFKVAYLDKYEFVTEDHKNTLKESDGEIAKEVKTPIKEVTIIKNESPRENSFFKMLGGIALGFGKALLVLFSLPIMFLTLVVCFFLAVDIYMIANGIVFVGTILFLIFALIACIWCLESISIVIFNRKFPFKRLLWTFIGALIGIGASIGICALELSRIEYIDEGPESKNLKVSEKTQHFDMKDDLKLLSYYYAYDGNIKYKVDDNVKDVIVGISYYEDLIEVGIEEEDNTIVFTKYFASEFQTMRTIFGELKTDLKNKKVYDYSKLSEMQITITASKENIEKIKANTKKENDRLDEYYNDNECSSYEFTIDNYEKTVEDLQSKIDNLEEEKAELNEKITDLEDYKSRVKDILGE